MNLEKERILITGANGFLGKHLQKSLKSRNLEFSSISSADYDLRIKESVYDLFNKMKPTLIFSLAAKVGGILDNKNNPATFYYDNVLINTYIYEASKDFKIKKLINVGAGCGYPLNISEPLKEEQIWDGFPQNESAPYSIAKKMLILQGLAYRKQYNLSSITLIPSNIYGEHDNFDLEKSHVIPALIRKFYEANLKKDNAIEVWGNGTAKRDFIHAHDIAESLIHGAINYDDDLPINICNGIQHSIKDVVDILREISNYKGNIFWNINKPSGQDSRLMSTNNRRKFMPNYSPVICLKPGLQQTYQWFSDNYNNDIRL
jgi:GDP-L-fucose synthase